MRLAGTTRSTMRSMTGCWMTVCGASDAVVVVGGVEASGVVVARKPSAGAGGAVDEGVGAAALAVREVTGMCDAIASARSEKNDASWPAT